MVNQDADLGLTEASVHKELDPRWTQQLEGPRKHPMQQAALKNIAHYHLHGCKYT